MRLGVTGRPGKYEKAFWVGAMITAVVLAVASIAMLGAVLTVAVLSEVAQASDVPWTNVLSSTANAAGMSAAALMIWKDLSNEVPLHLFKHAVTPAPWTWDYVRALRVEFKIWAASSVIILILRFL